MGMSFCAFKTLEKDRCNTKGRYFNHVVGVSAPIFGDFGGTWYSNSFVWGYLSILLVRRYFESLGRCDAMLSINYADMHTVRVLDRKEPENNKIKKT